MWCALRSLCSSIGEDPYGEDEEGKPIKKEVIWLRPHEFGNKVRRVVRSVERSVNAWQSARRTPTRRTDRQTANIHG